MAATSVEICNSALTKLGAETITALSDNTRRAKLCNQQYDRVRKRLLRSHPWNFAMKRTELTPYGTTSAGLIAEAGSTDQIITLTGHSLLVGDHITIVTATEDIVGEKAYVQTVVDANNVTLNIALSATVTAADTFDSVRPIAPDFGYDLQFVLPTDYLRGVVEADHFTNWKIEGTRLLANQQTFQFIYISDISTTTEFDVSFDELLAVDLARELAYPLVQSMSLKEEMSREYNILLRDVRSHDAQEGNPQLDELSEWILARQ